MSSARFSRIVRQLVHSGIGTRPIADAIGSASADMLGTPHCGLLVLDSEGQPTVASSTPLMAELEDLEVTLGVGPCTTAWLEGRLVAEPDLARVDPERWPGFCVAALGAGALGAYAFPLLAVGGPIGSMNVARVEAGTLAPTQLEDGAVLASVVAQLLLTGADGAWAGAVDDVLRHGAIVHQATGMVGAQLEVPMAVGLAVLRARAFADNRPLAAVSAEVVHRHLRFDAL